MASTSEAVREMLVTKSVDYAGRPQTYSTVRRTLGGKDIAFGNYGPAWTFHRKLFTTALRHFTTDVPMIEKRISSQAKKLVQFMEKQDGQPFDPAGCLMQAVADVICGITFGEGFNTTHPDLKCLLELCTHVVENEKTAQLVTILDFFPLAKYLPIKAYDRFIQPFFQMHKIIKKFLKERKDNLNPKQPIQDFISGLLCAREEAKLDEDDERSSFLCDEYLVNSIQNMFGAGYETTSTTLKWVIAFLVNYPKYQEDIHRELDEVLGGQSPSLTDRPNLPLIQATIFEALRVGNVGPLLLPHVTTVDTTLLGYRVPKGTIVFANTEAVHLDPKCWEDASVFNPYRHLDKEGQLIIPQRNFYPFGAGRRVCAGEALAKVELFLFVSWLFQNFTFVAERDGHPPSLKGILSITQFPAPYKIRAIKRKASVFGHFRL
ncbi:steroid 17-alpha-hydroxylase/17,20 lyase-like isoform X2 [Acropora palmata]